QVGDEIGVAPVPVAREVDGLKARAVEREPDRAGDAGGGVSPDDPRRAGSRALDVGPIEGVRRDRDRDHGAGAYGESGALHAGGTDNRLAVRAHIARLSSAPD